VNSQIPNPKSAFRTPVSFPPFPGFRPEAFEFLRGLKANNDRDWFNARKSVYEDELLWPMRCLVAEAGEEARRRGLPLTADPQKAVFRIYRDTRFSKDKTPYKVHVGAVLSRSGGRSAESGVLYIHLEPGACFVGGGFWHPDPKAVRRWRERMAADPDGFLDVASRLEEAGLQFERSEQLKRLPRGFESYADGPLADYLRLQNFAGWRDVPDEAFTDPAFTETVVNTARDLMPLLEYGWALE
jgi:uncharacterized protein (TIGR02453 family)